jgi:regulator of sirC expression with transglutaminase-like and TPR domain
MLYSVARGQRPVTESQSRRQFRDLLARDEEAVDLAEAALLIACEEYPGLDVAGYLTRLDVMARELQERLAEEPRPERAVMALNRYFFQEQGFHGNTESYYDPRNSYLNDVLDRRTGIPITLSAVYMEVARRAGLRVEGVGLPGHFIVRVNVPGRGVLIDPYHCGALLSERECQERLDRIFGGRVKMEARMLEGCGTKAMIERMLRNLKAIHVKEDDLERALSAVELLLRLDPENAEDLRDRGVLYAALDCYSLAVRDLEAYLALAPGSPEAQDLALRVAALRQKATRLN